jgi:isoquinoline 1-oxidoreductase beta subunit
LELTAAEGKPRIERIVIAVDCGRVISSGILDRQIEGGVLFAVSTAAKRGDRLLRRGRAPE